MSRIGDHSYTADGKRKYIGLHTDLLDRPWTAKRQRGPKDHNLLQHASIPRVTGIKPVMMMPHGGSLLVDIDTMARMFGQVCGQQDAIACFSDDEVSQSDDKLQIAKQKVREKKALVAETLSSCLKMLAGLTDSKKYWANEVFDLTLKRVDGWEGATCFLPATSSSNEAHKAAVWNIYLPKGLVDKAFRSSPLTDAQKYSRYLLRSLVPTLQQIQEGKSSVARKRAFVSRAYVELLRLVHMPNGYQHALRYCAVLCTDMLLAHPRYLPVEIKESKDHEM
jgi:hypothetical protein